MNRPPMSGGKVPGIRFTSDSSRMLYIADQDSDELDELYSLQRGSLGRPDYVFGDGHFIKVSGQ